MADLFSTQKVIHGDCLDVMKSMEPCSVDCIVTDPPYMIGFMNKDFDKFNNNPASSIDLWKEALRITKPGGMCLAFGGDRTHHHLMMAMENAGWEIRTCLYWITGQGFPKSHNFGNKLGGEWEGYGTALKPAAEIIVMAMRPCDGTFANNAEKWGVAGINIDKCRIQPLTCQRLNDIISDNEVIWELERLLCNSCVNLVENKTKPEILEIVESFAIKNAVPILTENVKQFLIDLSTMDIGCLNTHCQEEQNKKAKENSSLNMWKYGKNITALSQKDLLSIILTTIPSIIESKICSLCQGKITHDTTLVNTIALKKETLNMLKERVNDVKNSRWPANLILDEEAAKALDEMSGYSKSPGKTFRGASGTNCMQGAKGAQGVVSCPSDSGGASRFFYCPKASSSERNAGLEGMPDKDVHRFGAGIGEGLNPKQPAQDKNFHPTVKPIKLMEYLLKLVMPPFQDAVVLDPFAGSGSTLVAAKNLGFNAIGIEKEAEYCEIANRRIA